MPHDRFYGIAAEEVARQEVDKDLFARAYAMALGDAEKTKAIYIGIRAERLEEMAVEYTQEQYRKSKELEKQAKDEAKRRAKDEAKRRATVDSTNPQQASTSKPPSKRPEPQVARQPNPPAQPPLAAPESFSDPKIAEAVRAMREALSAGGGRRA